MNTSADDKYLNLLKKSLVSYKNAGSEELFPLELIHQTWKTKLLTPLNKLFKKRNFEIVKTKIVSENDRINGYDWPANAKTMVGLNRLNNVHNCITDILKNKIPGDFVETGVWRGGVIIFMAALLEINQISGKKIWAFDSFEGLPKPNPIKYPKDKKNQLHSEKILSVSLDDVKNNFKEYDIALTNVIFKKGWFKDTLPESEKEISNIALLRLDGDYYESTILALTHLYPKLSQGGYLIIDDYNAFECCKSAVDDYRKKMGIKEPIQSIDKEAIFWQRVL